MRMYHLQLTILDTEHLTSKPTASVPIFLRCRTDVLDLDGGNLFSAQYVVAQLRHGDLLNFAIQFSSVQVRTEMLNRTCWKWDGTKCCADTTNGRNGILHDLFRAN